MPFCSKCGAEVTGAFCAKCGTPVGGNTPNAGPTEANTGGVDNNLNLVAMLCYLGGIITGIIFLVLAPYNHDKTVRFHAFQSIFVCLGTLVVSFSWGIIVFVTSMIVGILGSLMSLLGTLIWLGFFALWIYLMVSAYQGKKVVLPIVGQLAEKQA